jgi:chorismate dehydratase
LKIAYLKLFAMGQRASDSIPAAGKGRLPVGVTIRSTDLGTNLGTIRIGAVSYLNSRPLIYGLGGARDGARDGARAVQLSLDVPARLLEGLREGQYDVALLPIIDYQRMEGLVLVPAGGIGCDGPTLTVRLFARGPIGETRMLACDPESHTSVALARIILAERFGIEPRCIDLREASSEGGSEAGEARLLIGDKVVCEQPAGFDHQLDLGSAWKELTGRPFVFAAWVARRELAQSAAGEELIERLRRAKREGLAAVEQIIQGVAVPLGWPAELAREYLTQNLSYDIGAPQLDAIRHFFDLAARHGLIEKARALEVMESSMRPAKPDRMET